MSTQPSNRVKILATPSGKYEVWVGGVKAKEWGKVASSRRIFRTNSVVVKLDTRKTFCSEQCKRGAKVLRSIKSEDSGHFPKLIAAGRKPVGWIAVTRLGPFRSRPTRGAYDRIVELGCKYRIGDLLGDTGRYVGSNWRCLKDGTPVILDAGCESGGWVDVGPHLGPG